MSDRGMGRRTEVEVAIAGTDVTGPIRRYLKALIYTDSEEDEADDLQIVLQDRDGIWMEQWLNDVIEAAASAGAPAADVPASGAAAGQAVELKNAPFYYTSVSPSPSVYKSGTFWFYDGLLINGRYRMTNSAQRCGKLPVGRNVTGWVPAGQCAGASGADGSGNAGTTLEAVIVRRNWNSDGRDDALDCGSFELDAVDCDGPPAEVTLRGTALPFRAQIRQTKKSWSWENCHMSAIAREMAEKNGMVCMFLASGDPFYQRVEQFQESDIAFLKRLCADAGYSLKATGKILVIFQQADYEKKDAVRVIRKAKKIGSGGADAADYIDYHLSVGTADTQYQSCRVSYNDPATGKCIEGIARIPDYKESDKNQQLEITARVGSVAEAERLAAARLRKHNKYCRTAEFTLPGDPALVAGVIIELSGWGGWDGAYIVKQAVHTVNEGGYTTKIILRQVLKGL